jgi:hypothetical protein
VDADAHTPPVAEGLRYEVSILIGPCTQQEAEDAMVKAHEAVKDLGPGTTLKLWNEEWCEPGDHVEGVEILG